MMAAVVVVVVEETEDRYGASRRVRVKFARQRVASASHVTICHDMSLATVRVVTHHVQGGKVLGLVTLAESFPSVLHLVELNRLIKPLSSGKLNVCVSVGVILCLPLSSNFRAVKSWRTFSASPMHCFQSSQRS